MVHHLSGRADFFAVFEFNGAPRVGNRQPQRQTVAVKGQRAVAAVKRQSQSVRFFCGRCFAFGCLTKGVPQQARKACSRKIGFPGFRLHAVAADLKPVFAEAEANAVERFGRAQADGADALTRVGQPARQLEPLIFRRKIRRKISGRTR